MLAYERLIEYTKSHTGSFENADSYPSNPEEVSFAHKLCDELKSLGVEAFVDEFGYVMGKIPSNNGKENGKVLGFIAHMDTVSDVEYRNVKTQIIKNYQGQDIVLNKEENIVMTLNDFPILEKYLGDDLILTDGKTILGADDKAGIAEIMTLCERLHNDKSIKHGEIAVCFTPDEEVGMGTEHFDIEKFGADYAYTVDGASFGQIEYENFNAINTKVVFKGKSVHPGDAKYGGMKNASRIAMEFDSLLPPEQKPEYTEGYEGFYHLISIEGSVEEAISKYILRDHDETNIKIKRAMFDSAADFLNKKYGKGTVECEYHNAYKNMATYLKNDMHLIDNAVKAIEASGGNAEISPIRGGTDGARLSEMGLPCPNLGTGSQNHHGRFEFAGIKAMEKCVDVLLNITKLYN